LQRLETLALDVLWAWNHAGDAVWRRLDPELWERTQNAWLLLQYVPFERLERLAADPEFLREVDALERPRERYRATPPWRTSGSGGTYVGTSGYVPTHAAVHHERVMSRIYRRHDRRMVRIRGY
jgi:starch phosphorylase